MSKNYGEYQIAIYADGMYAGGRPVVTTDPQLLEEQAHKALDSKSFTYIAGGAGERATMDSNRLAFREWKLIPRMLKTSTVDTSVQLFGKTYPTPLFMAPIGVQSLAHADKEPGLAKACADLEIPYIMSSAASSTIEEVATANGDGARWYQLYWPSDNDVTLSLLKRAREHGFDALVVTLDTWTLAWRPGDLDQAFLPFLNGTGTETGLSDPVFRAKFEETTGTRVDDNKIVAAQACMRLLTGQNHTWKEVAFLRQNWDGPLILKGIQHVDDAKAALSYGCDGIVVSNHGGMSTVSAGSDLHVTLDQANLAGRQLDGAIGSLEVLPEIVDAVGSQMTVLFDSGIRTGSDIIKALALGAKAVFIGRPVMYGYAVNGTDGAKAVLQGLLADLYLSMGLVGLKTVGHCRRDAIRKVTYGGDLKAVL